MTNSGKIVNLFGWKNKKEETHQPKHIATVEKQDAYENWELNLQQETDLATTTSKCLKIFSMAPNSDKTYFIARKKAITKAMVLAETIEDVLEVYEIICKYYQDSDLINQCRARIDEIFQNEDIIKGIKSKHRASELLNRIPEGSQIAKTAVFEKIKRLPR